MSMFVHGLWLGLSRFFYVHLVLFITSHNLLSAYLGPLWATYRPSTDSLHSQSSRTFLGGPILPLSLDRGDWGRKWERVSSQRPTPVANCNALFDIIFPHPRSFGKLTLILSYLLSDSAIADVKYKIWVLQPLGLSLLQKSFLALNSFGFQESILQIKIQEFHSFFLCIRHSLHRSNKEVLF